MTLKNLDGAPVGMLAQRSPHVFELHLKEGLLQTSILQQSQLHQFMELMAFSASFLIADAASFAA